MMTINLNDLIVMNEAAKMLKQRDFMIYRNSLYGLDNFMIYICRIDLNPNRLSAEIINDIGLQFNTRELSAFINNLSTESVFEIDTSKNENILHSKSLKAELHIIINKNVTSMINSKIYTAKQIDRLCSDEEEITDNISDFYLLKKDGGGYYYIHDNKYYMTLFNGLLPLNKSDKIFLSINDNGNNTFIARFRIKKKYNVFVYVSYLKV